MPEQAEEVFVKTAWIRCLLFLAIWFTALILFSLPFLIFFDLLEDERGLKESMAANLPYLLCTQAFSVAAALFATYIMRKKAEHEAKAFPWLRLDVKGFLQGAGLASILIGLSAALLYLTGSVDFTFQEIAADLALYLVFFMLVAIHEEVLCRGYLLHTLHKAYGKWAGIIISTLIFTAFHIPNDHVGWIGLGNIFLSGLLMALFFLRKRNLWAPIGIHFAWNYVQGPVFGFAVSGNAVNSLLEVEYVGSELFTGGKFGMEGSIISLTVLVAMLLLMIGFQNRRNLLPLQKQQVKEVQA